jgi:hypothetical protein
MNIFILDLNPSLAAQYHCDQHVIKMLLESAQMLCTVARQHGFDPPYRSTHAKHPCTLWLGESRANWAWLIDLSRGLNNEYRKRYNKSVDHKSWMVIQQLECPEEIPDSGLTQFAQAMPDEYKVPGDPVAAYRTFYIKDKAAFAEWRYSEAPPWFQKEISCASMRSH